MTHSRASTLLTRTQCHPTLPATAPASCQSTVTLFRPHSFSVPFIKLSRALGCVDHRARDVEELGFSALDQLHLHKRRAREGEHVSTDDEYAERRGRGDWVGTDGECSPRHRMPLNSIKEGPQGLDDVAGTT